MINIKQNILKLDPTIKDFTINTLNTLINKDNLGETHLGLYLKLSHLMKNMKDKDERLKVYNIMNQLNDLLYKVLN